MDERLILTSSGIVLSFGVGFLLGVGAAEEEEVDVDVVGTESGDSDRATVSVLPGASSEEEEPLPPKKPFSLPEL